jgi:catechol 2,3-dioxygenase-like lactoylglutathione lyase family enzyme
MPGGATTTTGGIDRMLSSGDVIAFVATSDLARSRPFYEDVLGLHVVESSPWACVFDANGTMLRLTPAGTVAVAPYTILGWRVHDIAAVVRWLIERGVPFRRYEGMDQDDAGIWTTPNGDRIAWFNDPDGHTLSVTQFAVA